MLSTFWNGAAEAFAASLFQVNRQQRFRARILDKNN
jgi:hypothetical protein